MKKDIFVGNKKILIHYTCVFEGLRYRDHGTLLSKKVFHNNDSLNKNVYVVTQFSKIFPNLPDPEKLTNQDYYIIGYDENRKDIK